VLRSKDRCPRSQVIRLRHLLESEVLLLQSFRNIGMGRLLQGGEQIADLHLEDLSKVDQLVVAEVNSSTFDLSHLNTAIIQTGQLQFGR